MKSRGFKKDLILCIVAIFSASLTIFCGELPPTPVEEAPVASITPSSMEVTLGETVYLDGEESYDPDNDLPLNYLWGFESRPELSEAEFDDDTSATPSFTPDKPGIYIVTLGVADSEGNSSNTFASATVTVTDPGPGDEFPIAVVGREYWHTFVSEVVQLDGRDSFDPDGDVPLNYGWGFESMPEGSTASFNDASSAYPIFTPDLVGEYRIVLSVIDSEGNLSSNQAECVVNVHPIPDTPEVIVRIGGPYTGLVGETIAFDGSATYELSPGEAIYDWHFGDGSAALHAGPTTSHTYAVQGTYTVTLTVWNSARIYGASTTATITITQPPVAGIVNGPYSGSQFETITFDGSASYDPEGAPLTYKWNFGDGLPEEITFIATTSHAYSDYGEFDVTLTVSDGIVESTPATTTATISQVVSINLRPTADPGGPYTGLIDQAITFDGSASYDPEGAPLTYIWDFGDGSPVSTLETPSHSYTNYGTFVVTLSVSDGVNTSDPASVAAAVVRQLPDTGQTAFYDNYGEISENIELFPRQDAAYNEDISFVPITDPATNATIIVHDEIADFLWHADVISDPMTYAQAETYCAESVLGGFTEWRIPSRSELITIVNYGSLGTGELATFEPFQGTTVAGRYWTSSPDVSYTEKVLVIGFEPWENGASMGQSTTPPTTAYVRCVQGTPLPVVHDFTDNDDGTITDRTTGYMWTKTPVVTTFDDPIDWQTALQYCNETVLGGDNGGYGDWRLPTIKQLETLTAFDNTQAPVFDSIFNLGEDFDYYTGFWSSTTNDTTNSSAWSINFAYGWIPPANPGTPEKLGYGYEHDVFCVRKLY